MGFSAFLHKQAAILETLHRVTMLGHITEEKERRLLNRQFAIFRIEWEADATNREGRFEQEEQLAQKWAARMADEEVATEDGEGNPLPTVDDVLRDWNTAASYILEVKIQKKLHGLAFVEDHREKVTKARRVMEEARFRAANLPPAHNQYFWCRQRQQNIMMERTEDLALGIPIRDYSEVKDRLADGTNVLSVISDMPWAYQRIKGLGLLAGRKLGLMVLAAGVTVFLTCLVIVGYGMKLETAKEAANAKAQPVQEGAHAEDGASPRGAGEQSSGPGGGP